jgi:hypothetical protein
MNIYFVRPEISLTASSIVQGISDRYGVIMEVEWEENCCVSQVQRLVQLYNKTDVLSLKDVLRDKFEL